VLDHVVQLEAAESIDAEHIADLRERFRAERLGGGVEPEVRINRGEDAKAIADTPHLTGDLEWDAMELAATAPDRDL